jgi:putative SOS response-associated peptidase YedK
MRPLHNRMPVILDPKEYPAWLDGPGRKRNCWPQVPAVDVIAPSKAWERRMEM